MKAYLLGILTTIVALVAIGYFYVSMGFLNTKADIPSSGFMNFLSRPIIGEAII